MASISGTPQGDTFQFLESADSYTGGGGADVYVVGALWYAAAGKGARFAGDTITDFSPEDRLDLGSSGTWYFQTGAFRGFAGEIRFEKAGGTTIIQADGNGDGTADATLTLTNGAFDLVHVGRSLLAIAGTPTGGADVLAGASGADTISGLGGNDLIEGREGDDEIRGGSGDDALFGEFNLVSSDIGNDVIYGDEGNDLLVGGKGNDRLRGGSGDDILVSGNDITSGYDSSLELWGGSWYEGDGGDDIIDGGDDVDLAILTYERAAGITIDISNPSAVFTILSGGVSAGSIVNVERLYFNGSAGNDAATGGGLADQLLGGGGGDTLHAAAGNDLLAGGEGDDTLLGGEGNDTLLNGNTGNTSYDREANSWSWNWFFADGGNDVIDGGAGRDTAVLSLDRVAAMTVDISNPSAVFTILEDGVAAGSITNVEQLYFTGGIGADTVTGGALNDVLYGNGGNDVFRAGGDNDTLSGGGGNDDMSGDAGVDTATFTGNRANYTVTQGETGVFTVTGTDGTDTLRTTEYARFNDLTLRLLPGTGTTVNFQSDNPATYMSSIRDFDGNDLGGIADWTLIGEGDANGDGDIDRFFINQAIGRFAEVAVADDGKVYFADHGWAGETRVVGIYVDPLVQSGEVQLGGPNDSQRRFQNDLAIGNIKGVLGAGDYNDDGLQEVYFSLTDGTAYLHAYMHADGNIQYANYQSQAQVIDYLTQNGWAANTYAGWFA